MALPSGAPPGTLSAGAPPPAAPAASAPAIPAGGWMYQGVVVRQQNVTGSHNIGIRPDLKKLHAANRATIEYTLKRHPACVMRIRGSTALLYPSGKLVVSGCHSVEAANDAANKYVRLLNAMLEAQGSQDRARPPPTFGIAIQNIVAGADLGCHLELERLQNDHSALSSYEPELFPGLILRLEAPKVVMLLYASGRVTLTGSKNVLALQRAFEVVYPLLVEYRKN